MIRDSTACAKKPIRAVAQYKVGVRGTTCFVRVTDDQYSEMLANSAEAVSKTISSTEASQPFNTKIVPTLTSSLNV